VSVNSPGNPWSQSGRRKGGLRWEGFAEKEGLSLEWKSEGVKDDESGELTELMEEVPLNRCGCVVVVVWCAWSLDEGWHLWATVSIV